MKLSEMSGQAPELKVLVYGESGAGKTCLASTFPKPMLILDFDGKSNSIINFLGQDNPELENIEVKNLQASLVEDPMEAFVKITKELEGQLKKGTMPYKTIIVDSLTTFSAAALNHIVKTNPTIKRPRFAQGTQPVMQDYGILRREFQRLIPGFLGLKANIVMIGHIKITTDETTGSILREPKLDGSFGGDLPIYFEEVYVAEVDRAGKRSLLTNGKGKYPCRTQRGLPDRIQMSYDAIINRTGV